MNDHDFHNAQNDYGKSDDGAQRSEPVRQTASQPENGSASQSASQLEEFVQPLRSNTSSLEQWKAKYRAFVQTPEGREWQWYGICFAGFVGFLLLIVVLMDLVVMPMHVGLSNVIRVPNVAGMNQRAAFDMLQKQGLQPVVRGAYFNNTIPAGYITAQLPYAASEVKPDRKIYLDVSKGKQMVVVPNLIGLTLREAKLALLRVDGLALDRVSYNYNSSLPPDYIYSQSVAEGTTVAIGAMVDVVVSLGAEEQYVMVPDLEGKSELEVEAFLSTKGLTIGTVSTADNAELNSTLRAGTVVAQIPQKGDSVRSGTPVNITVTR
jgi:eukaryotic-like serine/threonine-protein kinase